MIDDAPVRNRIMVYFGEESKIALESKRLPKASSDSVLPNLELRLSA
jgi:hypothetical protein